MRLLLFLTLACHQPPATLGDPTLPEASVAIEGVGARATLSAASDSLDPAIRSRALHWLVRADDIDEWGPRAAYDPSPWVQRAAIQAMLERTPPETDRIVALAQRTDVDPAVRAMAALAVPEAPIDLSNAWVEAQTPWDRIPLALAAWVHGDVTALAGLSEAVSTGELDLDLALIDALAIHGSAELLPALERAQERAEPELSIAIAVTRLRLGDAKGEVPLRKALSDDTHTRMEVLDRLARWPDPVADALIRKARGAGPDLVRTHAELLLVARTGEQPGLLKMAAAAPDREVRLLAMEASALALEAGPAQRALARVAMETLAEGLSDDDPSVRAKAASVIASHGPQAHRVALEELLTDEVEAVRVEAAGALLCASGS